MVNYINQSRTDHINTIEDRRIHDPRYKSNGVSGKRIRHQRHHQTPCAPPSGSDTDVIWSANARQRNDQYRPVGGETGHLDFYTLHTTK
jgi:Tfp pilus assembly pilus retraction ATPase PilT